MSSEITQNETAEIRPVAPASAGAAGGATAVLDRPIKPPGAAEPDTTVYVASQWKLMWWKFRKHKLAMIGGVVVILLYLIAIFAEFLAPTDPTLVRGGYNTSVPYTYAQPQRIRFLDRGEGGTSFRPHVYDYTVAIDRTSLRRTFVQDDTKKIYLRLFAQGTPYKLLGFIPTTRHLIGTVERGRPLYLFGSDRNGADVLSRLISGTRISMSIGLIGVLISLVLGITLGGISGYYGGRVDTLIQRFIEFLVSIPRIPLFLGLAAALPQNWSPLRVYFFTILILSIIGWTGLARVVRGRFLSLREEDFVLSARLDGSSEMRVILRHMVPSFASHIIASLTLAIPATILAETALSFLGLGLRSPINSWGVLLQEAQNVRTVATAPWLLLPGLAVVAAVLSLNFLGDGLRDAADPYR
ncbi:MAG: ABC transporter, permease protein 2 (cluster 5, nickel/peptides/opines) [uncultured Thermomicrobiales bacterium]|uniref:ABC transporter, permease protein 2 (Cluster 5, nickel/peptides/opines) n=1 Tax=uncultured Thermomicrobiales bacterium TaxID=1645740 RepID=A0A6J4VF75_9BACT|nr:MAG: ABC transporter, permease protein 2 (cluster 5, nickel/peptides/opines) [uncultured Thermomicrobiales bacterium]